MRDGITTGWGPFSDYLRRTLTWDKGTKLALHQQITELTGTKVYFCDAHSPWQRGTNELAAPGLLPQAHRPARSHSLTTSGSRRRGQRSTPQKPRLGPTG